MSLEGASVVLVVDDDVLLRRSLGALLELHGHEVMTAGTAEEAMELVEAEITIGVVMTDIRLPSASGVSLLRHARRCRPDVEVILMSGHPTLESAAAALKLGAHDYLFKPFAPDEVARVVGEAAARGRQRREERAQVRKQVAHLAVLREAFEARSQELRESAARYHELVENLDLIVFEVDIATRALTHVGGGLVSRFIEDTTRSAGIDILNIVHPEDRARVEDIFQALRLPGASSPPPFEVRMFDVAGETVFVRCVPSLRREAPGFISAVLVDVTARRVAELELEQAREILDRRILRDLALDDDRATFTVQAQGEWPSGSMIFGNSRAMIYVQELATRAGEHDEPVLITGATGTGKGALAAFIHRISTRADGPFVSVNCGSLRGSALSTHLLGTARGGPGSARPARPGLIEEAEGGTLFLDEVGEISLDVQAQLLSILENKSFVRVGESRPRRTDFRLLTATHRDLDQAVQEGSFRSDLLYRVDVVPIAMPTLRERAEDIPSLARFLAEATGARAEFAADTLDFLRAQPWSGNVRELRNAIVRAVLLARGRPLRIEHFEPFLGPEEARVPMRRTSRPPSLPPSPLIDERARILDLLERFDGNRAKVARTLGIARSSLYRKLKTLQLD